MSQLKKLDAMYNKVFVNKEPISRIELNAINYLIFDINKQENLDDIDVMILNKLYAILEESEKLLKRSYLKVIS